MTSPAGHSPSKPQCTCTPGYRPKREDVWGILFPVSSSDMPVIPLYKFNRNYTVGRHPNSLIHLPGSRVSNFHCRLEWNGEVDFERLKVTVHDYSGNGTFIKWEVIGKGNSHVLCDGDEIAFGSVVQPSSGPSEDYRYIFWDSTDRPRLDDLD
ncbi:hypothetical protein NMY22_g16262 [Coprinellus aureogranulatus]|nr:hypothetical protein NMY22_g16262 [Coprinellus aureogranulatus]